MAGSIVTLLAQDYARIQARYRTQAQRDRAWQSASAIYTPRQRADAIRVYQGGLRTTAGFEEARDAEANPRLIDYGAGRHRIADMVHVNLRMRLKNEDTGEEKVGFTGVNVTWGASASTLLGEAEAFVEWMNTRGSGWKLDAWELIGSTFSETRSPASGG